MFLSQDVFDRHAKKFSRASADEDTHKNMDTHTAFLNAALFSK